MLIQEKDCFLKKSKGFYFTMGGMVFKQIIYGEYNAINVCTGELHILPESEFNMFNYREVSLCIDVPAQLEMTEIKNLRDGACFLYKNILYIKGCNNGYRSYACFSLIGTNNIFIMDDVIAKDKIDKVTEVNVELIIKG